MGGGLQKTAMFIKLLKAKRETANGEIQVNPECVKRGRIRAVYSSKNLPCSYIFDVPSLHLYR
jgi:hypothetical protein